MEITSDKHYLSKKYYTKSHKFWLLGHMLFHKRKIILISFLTLIAIALQTFIPLLFGQAIDNVIPSGDKEALLSLATVIIILGILRGVISYVAAILNEQVAHNVEMQVRVEFFENLMDKNLEFFNKARVGDLMSQATQDSTNLTFAISPGIRSVVSAVFGLLAAGVAMLSLNVSLTVVFMMILPFYVYFMYRYAQRLQPVSVERQKRLAEINTTLQENLTGIRVVRTFSAQELEKENFTRDIRDYEQVLIKRGAISAYFIPSLLLGLITSLIFLLGTYIIEANAQGLSTISVLGFPIPVQNLTVGELIAFITLMGLLVFPTNILRFLFDIIMLGFAGSERIYNTLTTKSELAEDSGLILDNVEGKIEFNHVSFSYEPDNENDVQLALDDFDLVIEPGNTIAVIGPTGSGKTTIGKLLMRLYDVNINGNIKIDGVDIRDIDISQLRNMIGMIEQDIFLFSASIKANIAYGIADLDEEKIIAAAKAAQAHEFIMSFKNGYDTVIGEKGVTLSGGQRQRIAMARAFITDPKILIMDDSTSAIDAETEAKITSAMEELLENRTTIIITHRLATLKNADEIIFLRKGRIAKKGSHDYLMKSFEPYRQIFAPYQKLPSMGEN